MKILITGGKGFIGSHTVNLLLQKNHQIIIIDNLSVGENNIIDNDVVFLKDDINNKNLINLLPDDIDVILHLAAQISVQYSVTDPLSSAYNNIFGFLNILEIARKKNIKKFIFSSSAAIYGDNQNFPIKETELANPLSPYALEKLVSEQYLQLYKNLYGLDFVIYRYFNVFGKGQNANSSYSGVITKFLNAIKNNNNIKIFGDGKQVRDFVSVNDVAMANYLAITKNFTGIFNVATEKATDINRIANILNHKKQVNIEYLPILAGDIKYSLGSNEKITKIADFKVKTNLEQDLLKLLS